MHISGLLRYRPVSTRSDSGADLSGQSDGCHPGVFFCQSSAVLTPRNYPLILMWLMAVFAFDNGYSFPSKWVSWLWMVITRFENLFRGWWRYSKQRAFVGINGCLSRKSGYSCFYEFFVKNGSLHVRFPSVIRINGINAHFLSFIMLLLKMQ